MTTDITAKPRYSVSRKGMGGRKEKYAQEQLAQILQEAKETNLSAVCKQRELPYVSVRAALKRKGMWPVVIDKTEHAA